MAKSTAPIHIERVARVGGKEILFVTKLRSAVRIQKNMMEHRLGKSTGGRRTVAMLAKGAPNGYREIGTGRPRRAVLSLWLTAKRPISELAELELDCDFK
jgi:hypothetical protein